MKRAKMDKIIDKAAREFWGRYTKMLKKKTCKDGMVVSFGPVYAEAKPYKGKIKSHGSAKQVRVERECATYEAPKPENLVRGGASLISEKLEQTEKRPLFQCAAREACKATCEHSKPHTWHPHKGCGNDQWCVKLVGDAEVRQKNALYGYFDPRSAMEGKPKPVCVPL